MNQYLALIKRELWENRSFTWVPIIIAAIILLQAILILGFAALQNEPLLHLLEHADFNIEIDGNSSITSLSVIEQYSEQIKLAVRGLFSGMARIFYFPLLIIILFYFLDALFSERQDRSIFFWKSMPISDTQTVLGKLLTGAIIAPALTLAVIVVTQIVLMILLTPIVWAFEGSAWDLLWSAANPITFCISLIVGIIMQALWWSPVYAWCLLVSSWTKRSPVLFATLPIFALGIVELISSSMILRDTTHYVFSAVSNRLGSGSIHQLLGTSVQIQGHTDSEASLRIISISTEKLSQFFTNTSVWFGLIFATISIIGAIYIRRNRNEI